MAARRCGKAAAIRFGATRTPAARNPFPATTKSRNISRAPSAATFPSQSRPAINGTGERGGNLPGNGARNCSSGIRRGDCDVYAGNVAKAAGAQSWASAFAKASTVVPLVARLWTSRRDRQHGNAHQEKTNLLGLRKRGKALILSRENGCIPAHLVVAYRHERKRRHPGP